jgi:hypothetical protein
LPGFSLDKCGGGEDQNIFRELSSFDDCTSAVIKRLRPGGSGSFA